MTISHIGITVRNLARSVEFYAAALKPIGYSTTTPVAPHVHALANPSGIPDFWITGPPDGSTAEPLTGHTELHIALSADTRAQVDAFYEAAIKAGGEDNGKPGVRPYAPGYYGAFVKWDGVNLEAVTFAPEEK